jgi:hypothetical protein
VLERVFNKGQGGELEAGQATLLLLLFPSLCCLGGRRNFAANAAQKLASDSASQVGRARPG